MPCLLNHLRLSAVKIRDISRRICLPAFNMNHLKNLCFILWSLVNLASAAFCAFLCYFIMTLRFDEMHTSGTALNPMPDLTRETVVRNVTSESLSFGLGLLVLIGACWGLNYFLYIGSNWERYKKCGFVVSLGCSLILISGLVLADAYCLETYPQR
jgi:hypothetical protein